MIQDLKNLQESLNTKLRNRKSIVYLINKHRFQFLFENADEDAQSEVLIFIKEEKVLAVKKWISDQTGEQNLSDLRLLGQRYAIKNYSRISKKDLLKALHPYV